VILVVINIFSIRERKYEVGVLSAMGMKKRKIAAQFLAETLAVTLIAIIIGTAAGAVSSVPITNKLLTSSAVTSTDSFDRGGPGGSQPSSSAAATASSDSSVQSTSSSSGSSSSSDSSSSSSGITKDKAGRGPIGNYISSISSATDMKVVFEVLILGLLLSLAASAVAVNYIMRYDPLRILSERD